MRYYKKDLKPFLNYLTNPVERKRMSYLLDIMDDDQYFTDAQLKNMNKKIQKYIDYYYQQAIENYIDMEAHRD